MDITGDLRDHDVERLLVLRHQIRSRAASFADRRVSAEVLGLANRIVAFLDEHQIRVKDSTEGHTWARAKRSEPGALTTTPLEDIQPTACTVPPGSPPSEMVPYPPAETLACTRPFFVRNATPDIDQCGDPRPERNQ